MFEPKPASFLFVLLFWFFTVKVQSSAGSRPNIVIIYADDLGIGDVGCFGNDTINTPNIDSLCHNGAKFSHHVVAAPVCTPSRSALLTGRYPKRIGIHGDDSTKAFFRLPVSVWTPSSAGLPEEEVTFAEVAKEAGYKTGIIGKWHLGLNCPGKPGCHNPLNQGFDYWWGFPLTNLKDFGDDIPLKWVGRQWKVTVAIIVISIVIALTALLEMKLGVIGKKTAGLMVFIGFLIFFLYFSLMNLKFWNSMILRNFEVVERPIELDSLSIRMARETDKFIADSVATSTSSSSSSSSSTPSPFLLFLSFAHTHTALHALPEHKGRSAHGAYGDAIEELDWQVGQLLDALKRHSLLDNTLVYFSSDHGGHVEETTWGSARAGGHNGRFKGGKFQSFEGGIRVPTAVMWPGVVGKGSEVAALTSNMDVMATILDVLEVKGHPKKIDGKSLMPLFAATNEAKGATDAENAAGGGKDAAVDAATDANAAADAASGAEENSANEVDASEKREEEEMGRSKKEEKEEEKPAEKSIESEVEKTSDREEHEHASNIGTGSKDQSSAEEQIKLNSLESGEGHSLLLHYCDFLLNAATYEPDGPQGDIWKVHWRIPKWIPGTQGCGFRCDCFTLHEDVDPPVLYNLRSDPFEDRPLPLTSGHLRLLDDVTKMARAKDAELRGATPQMTPSRIYLNPALMPFCPKFPFLFCKDEKHKDSYLY